MKTKIVHDRKQINGTQNKPTFSDERTTATKYKNPILFDSFFVIFCFIRSAVKAFAREIHNDDSITNHNKERKTQKKTKRMSPVSSSFKSVRYTLRNGTFWLCECIIILINLYIYSISQRFHFNSFWDRTSNIQNMENK